MLTKFMIILIFAISLLSFNLKAQTLQIDLINNQAIVPANDLIYQNEKISSDEVMKLKISGVDISHLNPEVSTFYKNKNLDTKLTSAFPTQETPILNFESFNSSPTEIFRAGVTYTDKNNKKNRYILSTGIDVHGVVIRAKLLRKLGYNIDIPKFYSTLKVKFNNASEKQDFLLSLSDQTLTARSRWIKEEGENWLVLKSMVLEPVEIKSINIYWGVMDELRQETRRSFRALLIPFIITYYTENINLISWELGQVFDNKLLLSHPYADEFKNVTEDDLKWITRKILKLDINTWRDIFSDNGYPDDINELVLQKTLSRIHSLGDHLNISTEIMNNAPKANQLMTYKNIIKGKLTRFEESSDYALNFYTKNPVSPFRISELFRYFGTKLAYSSISYLIRKAQEDYIPIDPKDALRKLDEKNFDGEIVKDRLVSAPYINGRVRADRRIIFGQFLGSNAPIQIVDSFSIEANLGLLARSTNTKKSNPVFNIGGKAIRQFLHIKAMPDIRAATKEKLFNIYIPDLLKDLSKKISTVSCSISNKPFYKEITVDDKTYYQINFDENLSDGLKLANDLKQEMIRDGFDPSLIIILAINRDQLCEDEVKENTNTLVNDFLEIFSEDETFMVTDEIRLNIGANSVFSVDIPASIGVMATGKISRAFGRSFIIRKKNDGFEVVFHDQKSRNKELGYGFNYYINLFKHDIHWAKYKLDSDVFYLNLKPETTQEQKIALQTLKSLFSSRTEELINEHYIPTQIDHILKTKHNVFRFLFWSYDKFKMSHDLELKIEDKDKKEHTKTFSTYIKAKRNGKDFFDFGVQVVSDLFTGGLAATVLPQDQVDPGQSIAGNSERLVLLSEIETTPSQPLSRVTQLVWGYKGSKANQDKLFKIFDEIETKVKPFNRSILNQGPFLQMNKLRSYDITANLILYPEAHYIIEDLIDEKNISKSFNSLVSIYGVKEYQAWCTPEKVTEEKVCLPPKLKRFFRRYYDVLKVLDAKKKMELLSEAIFYLFNNFKTQNILKVIGVKNFLFTSNVSGFRTENTEGYVNLISDSVGTYHPTLGSGLLDYISRNLKISSYEVKAFKFAPGLQ